MPRRPLPLPTIHTVIGVDFSGAAKSGKTAWLAEMTVNDSPGSLTLRALAPLGRLAGSDDRADVCEYLSRRILSSDQSLFAMDFPFGLPIELGLGDWPDQLSQVQTFSGDAKEYGRSLVELTKQVSNKMHLRRDTDRETLTPFDCYHYRIIYQTFHGMRDVLAEIDHDRATAVLPFQYKELKRSKRVVVEACPSSTLKRLQLPHQKYKQSGGKPLEPIHKKTRQAILKKIAASVVISKYQRRVMMQNSGGDALDAVLAAVGGWHDFESADHTSIASHHRYPSEGRVYC